MEIKLCLWKVKFGDGTIPSVVYPRLMQPQMLQLSIWVLSKRFIPMGSVLWGQSHFTSTNRPHRGRSTTLRNPLLISGTLCSKWPPLPHRYRDEQEWLGQQASISFVLCLDTRIAKIVEVTNSWKSEALRTKKWLELLIHRIGMNQKQKLLQEGWLEMDCTNTSPCQFIMRRWKFGFPRLFTLEYYAQKGGAVWDSNITYGSGTEILWIE
jgi:hypothetical protein